MTEKQGAYSLGEALRAARLGWYPCYRRRCWLRITGDPGAFHISIMPWGHGIPAHTKDKMHRVLANRRSDSVDDLLDLYPPLRHVTRIKQPFSFVYTGE